MSVPIENPVQLTTVEDEQFVSADAFSSTVSAADWDSVVSQAGRSISGQSSSSRSSRWDRDSIYLKFDPLFNSLRAEGDAAADRLSSVFKGLKLAEPTHSGNEATAGSGANGEQEQSPAIESAPPAESAPPTQLVNNVSTPENKNRKRCTSEASSKYYSPTTSDIAENTLYTTALDTSTSPTTDNLDETVIISNSEVEVDVNGEGVGPADAEVVPGGYEKFRTGMVKYRGSGAAFETSETQVANPRAEQSICNDSFLTAFSQTVVVSSPKKPTRPVGVVQGKVPQVAVPQEETQEDLNGSQNVTPPSPPEQFNVTQIVFNRHEGVPAAEHDEQDPNLLAEDEGLADTQTPTNLSILEDTVYLASDNQDGSPAPELEACGAEESSPHPQPSSSVNQETVERIQRIQKLKKKLAQLDNEHEIICLDAKDEIAEKEAKLKAVMDQCDKEKLKLERKLAVRNLGRKERDQALKDLKQMETNFAELVAMYEAVKEVHPKLVQNCETLRKRQSVMKKILEGKDERDQAATQMVDDCLDVMRQDFQKKIQAAVAEGKRILAKTRIAELDVQQKEAKCKQLDIENAKLKEFCEGLAKDAN